MKGKGWTILLVLVFFAGLSLLLYPIVSNYWNSLHQAQVIVDYDRELDQLTRETYDHLLAEAEEWNRTVPFSDQSMDGSRKETYYSLLDPNDRDILGYLEIPSLGISLPVAHGTEEDTLQTAVGHLEWTSLPIGGLGTHCVLSGHRGLPSSELLTNIDRMEVGDRFSLHVLDKQLDYTVDHIAVVEPDDLSLLRTEAAKDYVTLVTCTPYGINSHRLLVRGVRSNPDEISANDSSVSAVPGEGSLINSLYPALLVLAGLIVVVFLFLLLSGNRKKKPKRGGARLQKPQQNNPGS